MQCCYQGPCIAGDNADLLHMLLQILLQQRLTPITQADPLSYLRFNFANAALLLSECDLDARK